MNTYTSLFSGGGGACLGFEDAGFEMIQGFEWDAQIVEVANANGLPVTEADVTQLNPKKLNPTKHLHASPVCTNVSVANTQASENHIDILSAKKVAEFITTWDETKSFSMENVMPYRNTESFAIILNALQQAKYKYRFFNMPFANYGVPQTRERLIVLAHKDYCPAIPTPTHSKQPENLFKSQWIGWYEVIEDLIDTLPESFLGEWQIKLIEAHYNINSINNILVNSTANKYGSHITVRKGKEPVFTQLSSQSVLKAFLIRSDNASSLRPYAKEEPALTTVASETVKSNTKAWLEHGRVVMMTPRANARFQSFPDSYILPDKKSLAQKIIGNAVPPLGAYHFAKELIR